MTLLLYVLGAIAKTNWTMWRFRFNFIPSNVLLLGLLATGVASTFQSSVDAIRNGSAPLRTSVGQIRDNPAILQNYVTVAGIASPVAMWEYGDKGANGALTSVDKSWFPLLDAETRQIIMVQQSGKMSGSGEPRETAVIGMLREMDSDLRQKLAAQRNEIEGIPVETRYMLMSGDEPGNSTVNVVLTTAMVAVMALFGVAVLLGHTIFQPTGRISSTFGVQVKTLAVDAVGSFTLENGTFRRRFVDVTAVLGRLDNGGLALWANIDASSRVWGWTTTRRVGIWLLAIEAGSVREPECGFLYWGTARKRACRFSYVDAQDHVRRKAVVAAPDEAGLDAAMSVLTGLGKRIASTT